MGDAGRIPRRVRRVVGERNRLRADPPRRPRGASDLSHPVLGQRRYWYANGAFNKPAIATGPMSWLPGFHHRSDLQLNYDPYLRLIHLHRMDYEICRDRHLSRKDRAWSERDQRKGTGVNNWPTDGWRLRALVLREQRIRTGRRAHTRRAHPGKLQGSVLNTLESRRNPIRTLGARVRNLVRRARRLPDPIRYRHTDEPLRHWQRIVMNDAIGDHITSLGPERLRCGGDQRGYARRTKLEGVHEPLVPRLRHLRADRESGQLRRRHLRTGSRARTGPLSRGPQSAGAVCPWRPGDRLHPFPDPSP